MDSNVLRLILIGLGVLLLLGIYLWDRLKRRPKGLRKLKRKASRERRDPGLAGPPPDIDQADEWRGGPPLEPEPEPAAPPVEKRGLFGRRHKKTPEAGEDPSARASSRGETDEMQAPLPFDEPAAPSSPPPEPLPEPEPSKIVVINVIARGAYFQGRELQHVADEVGMQPGEWNIFHRPDDHDPARAIFSMANIVEPGSFPVGHMDGFTTPGVCLFAQLPGPRDGLAVYSEMLFSAERIAALLDGELQDERHQLLTREKIERTRDEIIQQKRQLQLARKLR